jgi:hypothetical protein
MRYDPASGIMREAFTPTPGIVVPIHRSGDEPVDQWFATELLPGDEMVVVSSASLWHWTKAVVQLLGRRLRASSRLGRRS